LETKDSKQISLQLEGKRDKAMSNQTRNKKLCTISLLEHILLVSDVAHTIQSWDMTNKFALRLFEETQASIDQKQSGRIMTNLMNTLVF
jgi:hypothetical protein